MLKFTKINPIKNYSIEIDYYVPFTIKFNEREGYNENKIYWRTGNFNNSLLEIGIGENSKELKSITLVMANKINKEGVIFEVLEIIEGVPIFDTSMMNINIYDYFFEYNVSLTEDSVVVSFSEKKLIKTIFNVDRMEIGFGFDNELVFIRINSLTTNEYKDLKDSFKI